MSVKDIGRASSLLYNAILALLVSVSLSPDDFRDMNVEKLVDIVVPLNKAVLTKEIAVVQRAICVEYLGLSEDLRRLKTHLLASCNVHDGPHLEG
jgi:hypothetical protein